MTSAQSPSLENITLKLDFAVEGVTCPACMVTIETALEKQTGLTKPRYNLSTHRLSVLTDPKTITAKDIITQLDKLGYKARPFELDSAKLEQEKQQKSLLTALAVAAFAAMNVMLLSVSVWSGDTNMAPETRTLFHWLSALIAIPAVFFAGQPFFSSAFNALRHRHVNMDVPISLAILLALIMSVVQTATGGAETYFDSAVMLMFFLLIGRYLDFSSRTRTGKLGQNLLALQKTVVSLYDKDGNLNEVPANLIEPGDHIHIPAGSAIGVDGIILSGTSQIDSSLITGESLPQTLKQGDQVYAGTLNLSGTLKVEASMAGSHTLLSEISELLDKASEKRGQYVRLADRAASLYAPIVHILALITLIGWLMAGAGWQTALLYSIAVLIITCPCALGLAVPVVQVVATGTLFKNGVLVNQGDALERLAVADSIIFDKTGTLTEPESSIQNISTIPENVVQQAAKLALSSNHVLAKALSGYAVSKVPFENVSEQSGQGVSLTQDNHTMKLGSRAFCNMKNVGNTDSDKNFSELCFDDGKGQQTVFLFSQKIKQDAVETIIALKKLGFSIHIISGDLQETVAKTAQYLGIKSFKGGVKPQQKVKEVEQLQQQGHSVVMIGDGLNDAAALQSANVSLAPASAIDLTQSAADFVILGNKLQPLATTVRVARQAKKLMIENFTFAIIYNAIAVPLAIFGFVTPLIAALLMSASSILVTLNALRAQIRT